MTDEADALPPWMVPTAQVATGLVFTAPEERIPLVKRIGTVTRLEVGFSARSASDHRGLLGGRPIASMPVEHLTPRVEDRAVEVQAALAAQGLHRAPSIPDLLVAATAELAELTVLHLDKDFDLIAEVTGQPVERLTLV